MDLRTELQKGSFSDVLHGIVQQGMSGYTISQIIESATHMLAPYHELKHFVISHADTFFLTKLREHKSEFVFKGKIGKFLPFSRIYVFPVGVTGQGKIKSLLAILGKIQLRSTHH